MFDILLNNEGCVDQKYHSLFECTYSCTFVMYHITLRKNDFYKSIHQNNKNMNNTNRNNGNR